MLFRGRRGHSQAPLGAAPPPKCPPRDHAHVTGDMTRRDGETASWASGWWWWFCLELEELGSGPWWAAGSSQVKKVALCWACVRLAAELHRGPNTATALLRHRDSSCMTQKLGELGRLHHAGRADSREPHGTTHETHQSPPPLSSARTREKRPHWPQPSSPCIAVRRRRRRRRAAAVATAGNRARTRT